MSITTFVVLRCDRCPAEQTIETDGHRGAWGWISAAKPVDQASVVGPSSGPPSDLCPGCMAQLQDWWREPTGAVEPPVPEPRPRRFTLQDRQKAIAETVRVMSEAVSAAFKIVREQPTAILSQEIVPGALAGVDARAEALIDDLLDKTGVRRRRI